MTTFGSDRSNHDWGRGPMDVGADVAAGITHGPHKLTDGDHFYRDRFHAEYQRRARAAALRLPGSYHVLWAGSAASIRAQMDWFLAELTLDAPWWRDQPHQIMLDCEPFGYNGAAPSIGQINGAADVLSALTGGRYVAFVYAPKWVYEWVAGLRYPLVASAYGSNPAVWFTSAYPGDGSDRWAPYGADVVELQYGSRLTIGRQPTSDALAARMSIDHLVKTAAPGVTPPPPPARGNQMLILAKTRTDPAVVVGDGLRSRPVTDGTELAHLQDRIYANGGDPTITVYDTLDQVYGVAGRPDSTAPPQPTIVVTDDQIRALAEHLATATAVRPVTAGQLAAADDAHAAALRQPTT